MGVPRNSSDVQTVVRNSVSEETVRRIVLDSLSVEEAILESQLSEVFRNRGNAKYRIEIDGLAFTLDISVNTKIVEINEGIYAVRAEIEFIKGILGPGELEQIGFTEPSGFAMERTQLSILRRYINCKVEDSVFEAAIRTECERLNISVEKAQSYLAKVPRTRKGVRLIGSLLIKYKEATMPSNPTKPTYSGQVEIDGNTRNIRDVYTPGIGTHQDIGGLVTREDAPTQVSSEVFETAKEDGKQ